MNIENLSQSEKYSLLSQLEKSLGLYPLMVLTIDDVKESILDSGKEPPNDEKLHTMCKYVARKYDVADEYMVALDWATELCLEKHKLVSTHLQPPFGVVFLCLF